MCMWIFITFFEIRNDAKSVQANILRFLLVSHFGRTPSHTYTVCAHIHTHTQLGHTYTYSHTLHVNTYTTCAHIHIPTYTTCAHTPHIKFSGVTELWHFSCLLPCIYISGVWAGAVLPKATAWPTSSWSPCVLLPISTSWFAHLVLHLPYLPYWCVQYEWIIRLKLNLNWKWSS